MQRRQQQLQQPPATAAHAPTSSSRPSQPAAIQPPQSPRHQQRQQDEQQHGDITFLPASLAHCAAFESIQHAAYPAELWEEHHVFESILRHGCSFVAVQGASSPHAHVIGYLLIHAVPDPSSPPPLNHALPPPPPASQRAHLFVHDLCLLPAFHGGGLGARLVRHVLAALPLGQPPSPALPCHMRCASGSGRALRLHVHGLPACQTATRAVRSCWRAHRGSTGPRTEPWLRWPFCIQPCNQSALVDSIFLMTYACFLQTLAVLFMMQRSSC